MNLTHKELVNAAYYWILRSGKCGVAFKELSTHATNSEYPDVIGFRGWGNSVLIECKCSRSDFFADRKKKFRKNPEQGMGTFRFYCCPTGLLKVEDMPTNWGLIYVSEKGKAQIVHNPYCKSTIGNLWTNGFNKNFLAEHALMYSVLRRLHIRGHIDSIYTPLAEVTILADDTTIPTQRALWEDN